MNPVRKMGLMLTLSVALMFSVAAEAVQLKDFDDNNRSLDDYTGDGKWLVVMIWASDCHICNQEVSSYVDFHTGHKGKDATVLGISMDGAGGKGAALGFIERHAVNYPNLIGEPAEVASLFTSLTGMRLQGTPTFLIYSPDGKLSAQQAGAVPTSLIEQHIQRN